MSCCHWLSVWNEFSVFSLLRTPQWILKGWKEDFYLTCSGSCDNPFFSLRYFVCTEYEGCRFRHISFILSACIRCFVNIVSRFSNLLCIYDSWVSKHAGTLWWVTLGKMSQTELTHENTDLGDMVIIAITINSVTVTVIPQTFKISTIKQPWGFLPQYHSTMEVF